MEEKMAPSRTIPQRGITFDYFMWLFTRISGLAIILFAAINLLFAFSLGARTQMDMTTLLRWMFFPNPNHVVNSNIPDVDLGWSNAFWRILSMMIVFFTFTHGANGLRMIVEDYLGDARRVRIVRVVLVVICLLMIIAAVFVILSS